jgi:hypothetical protein
MRLILLLLLGIPFLANSQNTFPTSGPVGIGTTNPGGILDVLDGSTRMILTGNAGKGDVFRLFGVNGMNLAVNFHTPNGGDLITDLGINYSLDNSNGFSAYARIGAKKAPMIRLNAQDGSLSLLGENGTGPDYRTPAFNLGVYVGGNGNVGIGMPAPEAKFHVNGDSRYNGYGWFSKTNNGTNAVALKLGQNAGWDHPAVEIRTEDEGGTSSSSWCGTRWGHTVKFQRESATGTRNMISFGGTDGGHSMYIYSADGSTEKIRMNADGISFIQGSVAIGTTDPLDNKLAVNGNAIFTKVKVKQYPWADYVFYDDYKLPTLKEVEAYIKQYRHLPDVPSEKEIRQNGLDLGDNQATLLKKIEELTLYMIEMKNENDKLKRTRK